MAIQRLGMRLTETASLYTEKITRLIYEVKLFDDFVIVRPMASGPTEIRKMDHLSFSKEFEEYGGDTSKVYEYIKGVDVVQLG